MFSTFLLIEFKKLLSAIGMFLRSLKIEITRKLKYKMRRQTVVCDCNRIVSVIALNNFGN